MTIPTDRDSSGTSTSRPYMDEVNEASFDSFPASDAPSWSSMHAGPPKLRQPSRALNTPAQADDAVRHGAPRT
jgi:hypothetical protein